MKIPVLLTVVLTCLTNLGLAQTSSPAKAKPAAKAPAADVLSPSDKALVAYAGEESASLSASQKATLLSLANTGDSAALQKINGIGESKAKNIIAKRPYKSVDDLIMVDGIGKSTFKDVVIYAKGQQKDDATKAVATPKATPLATPKATPKAKKVAAPAAATPVATATPKAKKEKVAKTPAAATASPSPAASPTPKKAKAPKKTSDVAASPSPTP